MEEVPLAYELGKVDLHAPVRLRYRSWIDDKPLEYLDLSDEVYQALMFPPGESPASVDSTSETPVPTRSARTIGQVLDLQEAGQLRKEAGLDAGDEQEILDMLQAVGYWGWRLQSAWWTRSKPLDSALPPSRALALP
jgi:hypothetical protein